MSGQTDRRTDRQAGSQKAVYAKHCDKFQVLMALRQQLLLLVTDSTVISTSTRLIAAATELHHTQGTHMHNIFDVICTTG